MADLNVSPSVVQALTNNDYAMQSTYKSDPLYGAASDQLISNIQDSRAFEGALANAAAGAQQDIASANSADALATAIDSGVFEQSVRNRYDQFQTPQTAKMTNAANILADTQLAKQQADRKIENLTQQKEYLNQVSDAEGKFMKSLSLPPIIGDIVGLFNDDYNTFKQLSDAAQASANVRKLQNQDELDDQLTLQKAFGTAGYNPMANEVIKPSLDWEKQYFAEKDALQKNKLHAQSNKNQARANYIDVLKQQNKFREILAGIHHDAVSTSNLAVTEAGKAEEREKEYYKITSANERKEVDALTAMLEAEKARYVSDAKDRATNAKLKDIAYKERNLDENIKPRLGLDTQTLDFDMLKHENNMLYKYDKLAFDVQQLDYNERKMQSDDLNSRRAFAGKQVEAWSKLKVEQSRAARGAGGTNGSSGSGKSTVARTNSGLTTDSFKNVVDDRTTAAFNAEVLLQKLPLMQGISGDSFSSAALTNLTGKIQKTLAEISEPSVEDLAELDQPKMITFTEKVTNLNEMVEAVNSNWKAVNDVDSPEGKAITSLRLANNGVLPRASERQAATFTFNNNSKSVTTDSIEGRLVNSYVVNPHNPDGNNLAQFAFDAFNNAAYKSKKEFIDWYKNVNPQETKDLSLADINSADAFNMLLTSVVSNINSGKIPTGSMPKNEFTSKLFNPNYLLSQYINGNNEYAPVVTTTLANGKKVKRTISEEYDTYLKGSWEQYCRDAIGKQASSQLGISLRPGAFRNNISLGKYLIDNGLGIDTIASLFYNGYGPSVAQQWKKDYLTKTASYDNQAASFMVSAGFYDKADEIIATASDSASESNKILYANIENSLAQISEYARIKQAENQFNQALANQVINQSKKGK